jgi:hypothetical protein
MTLSNAALVTHFESLGRGCEFGFLQRLVGAEPMGLLRFAGLHLDGLVQGLSTRFAGIAEPDNVRLSVTDSEYWVEVVNFGFHYHTEMFAGDIAPEHLHRLECRKLRMLAAKLIAELEGGTRIFVYQQRAPLPAPDLLRLRRALSAYGDVTLLRVLEADAAHQAGVVEIEDDRMMVGYLQSFARREAVHEPNVASWIAVCRAAHDLWSRDKPRQTNAPTQRAANLGEPADARISHIVFGTTGNSGPCLIDGWADPEAGYTWAIGNSSSLKLPCRADAGGLLLTLSVWPFVRAPALCAQRLTVSVNRMMIASFRLTSESRVQCPVPAAVLAGRQTIDIEFLHPDAARPTNLVRGDPDLRELAVAFRQISLYWADGG